MTHLPIHPYTGLVALGLRRDGRPIWPVRGGDGTTPPPDSTPPADPPQGGGTPPADPPKPDDEPLREPGKRALEAERARVKALEQQLGELAPLKQIAELLGGKPTGDGKTDLERLTERLDGYERQIAEERQARWRAEIAAERGIKPELAERLRGSTREELLADADALLALIPTAPAGPRTPAPDPSQGARGSGAPDLDAQIREAQAKGDWRKVLSLQNQRLVEQAINQ